MKTKSNHNKQWHKGLSLIAVLIAMANCAPKETDHQELSSTGDESQIINGQNVQEGDEIAKTTVAIHNLKQQFICTGSIIASNIILTAAHCIEGQPKDYAVVFERNVDDLKLVPHAVESFVAHEGFDGDNIFREKDTKDIALIKLAENIPSTHKVIPFLASTSSLKKGYQVILAGYGLNRVSQNIFGELTGSGDGVLRKTKVRIQNPRYSPTEIQLDQTRNTGACNGDSGGPAYLSVNGQLFLWGVTSRGTVGCHKDVIYTNALAHSQWIQQHIQALDQTSRLALNH